MADFDNNMQVVMGKVISDNPNAPKMRVNFEIDGVKYKAGLWPMTRKDDSLVKDKNGNQLYKGKIDIDTFEPGESQQAPQAGAGIDDDIPF